MTEDDDFWTLPPLPVWSAWQTHRQRLTKPERHAIRRAVRTARANDVAVRVYSHHPDEERAVAAEMRKRRMYERPMYWKGEGYEAAWWPCR